MNTYKGIITLDMRGPNNILVFGSNTEGRHGKGVAKMAYDHWGAIYGQAMYRQGQSYAIITKDLQKKIHPSVIWQDIAAQIVRLYAYATLNPELNFFISYTHPSITLNGYTTEELARMFAVPGILPSNIWFEENFGQLVQQQLTNKHETNTEIIV